MQVVVGLTIPVQERAIRPTVLVLADDEDWRAAVSRTLEQEGFEVLAARHAGHALLVCRRHAGPVDLFIADEVGEQGSGVAVARPLAEEKPGMKRLLFTARPRTREALVGAVRGALA